MFVPTRYTRKIRSLRSNAWLAVASCTSEPPTDALLFSRFGDMEDQKAACCEYAKWDQSAGINPYLFAYMGQGLAICISVLGAAWCATPPNNFCAMR